MTGRPYVPHASRPGYSALSLIRGAVLAPLCALALAAFGHGFPLLLALLFGKV